MKNIALLVSLWGVLFTGALQPAYSQTVAEPDTIYRQSFVERVLQPAPLPGKPRVYALSLKNDLPVLTASASTFAAGYWLMGEVPVLTEEDIAGLDPLRIGRFDRSATQQYRAADEKLSDYLFALSAVAPLSVFASPVARNEFGPVLMMYAETAVLTRGLTAMSKGLFMRNRPFTYNAAVPMADKMVADARHSFFSGHMASTTAFCFLTASMVNEYAEQPGLKWAAWAGAVIIPGSVGYWRYTSGNHFPTDLLAGYLVGAGSGLLVPYLHRAQLPESTGLNIQPLPNGIYMSLTF